MIQFPNISPVYTLTQYQLHLLFRRELGLIWMLEKINPCKFGAVLESFQAVRPVCGLETSTQIPEWTSDGLIFQISSRGA